MSLSRLKASEKKGKTSSIGLGRVCLAVIFQIRPSLGWVSGVMLIELVELWSGVILMELVEFGFMPGSCVARFGALCLVGSIGTADWMRRLGERVES